MTYGVHGAGHGAAEAGSGTVPHTFHFPFFSPLALAALFTSIGAWGLIAQHGFDVPDGRSLLYALPAAVVTAYSVAYGAWRLAASSTGSSQIRTAALVGAVGEVITPIPVGGMGEVAAMVDGQRFNSAAREASGKAVPRGAKVTVKALVGGTLVVQMEE